MKYWGTVEKKMFSLKNRLIFSLLHAQITLELLYDFGGCGLSLLYQCFIKGGVCGSIKHFSSILQPPWLLTLLDWEKPHGSSYPMTSSSWFNSIVWRWLSSTLIQYSHWSCFLGKSSLLLKKTKNTKTFPYWFLWKEIYYPLFIEEAFKNEQNEQFSQFSTCMASSGPSFWQENPDKDVKGFSRSVGTQESCIM